MNLLEATEAIPTLDIAQLRSGLQRLWDEEDHRLIFRLDPDAEFEDALPLLKRAFVTDLAHSTRRENKLHLSVNHLLLLPTCLLSKPVQGQ